MGKKSERQAAREQRARSRDSGKAGAWKGHGDESHEASIQELLRNTARSTRLMGKLPVPPPADHIWFIIVARTPSGATPVDLNVICSPIDLFPPEHAYTHAEMRAFLAEAKGLPVCIVASLSCGVHTLLLEVPGPWCVWKGAAATSTKDEAEAVMNHIVETAYRHGHFRAQPATGDVWCCSVRPGPAGLALGRHSLEGVGVNIHSRRYDEFFPEKLAGLREDLGKVPGVPVACQFETNAGELHSCVIGVMAPPDGAPN